MSKIPHAVRQLFGKPPIMAGEDHAEYQELLELVRADVQPQDLQEWFLMKDIAHAEWELLRLRGMKVSMLHAMVPRAMKSLIADAQGLLPLEAEWVAPVRKLLMGVVAGDQKAKQDLEQRLEEFGLTLDVVTAATFGETITSQLHADRMVAAAYERRNAAYAELERRRAKQAKATTTVSDDDIVQEVDAPPIGDGDATAGRAGHSANGKGS
jgi:hypothetical protein